MKKTLCIILALCLSLTAAGCGSMFSAEYYYSEPYRESATVSDGTETEVRNASTLKRAITELIYAGETQGQFRFGRYNGSLMDDLAAVCLEIKTSTPMGAYAVEDISYDTSRIVSYYTADISIKYRKSAEEIAAVAELSGLAELDSHLISVLDAYSTGTVVKIYSSAASEGYIREFITESYYSDPLLVPVMPLVSVAAYPESGPERIYEIYFRYDAAKEKLVEMEQALREQLELYDGEMGADDVLSMALRCATKLAESCAGGDSGGVWAGTAYGALVQGSEDSFGMAMAYKALCDTLGIPCTVVRGEHRAEGGKAHAWNIIELEGEHYHVDLSRFYADAPNAFLLSDEEIWGEYDWDRESYPVCDGSMGPEDVFEIAQTVPGEPTPVESDAPQTPTPDPEQSDEPQSPEESPQPETPAPSEPVE